MTAARPPYDEVSISPRAPGLQLGKPDYLVGNFVHAVKSMPYTL